MREKVTMDVTLPRPNDLDGSNQLDEILSELLNETCGSPKKNPWSTDGRVGLDQQSGSITTQSGNSRTIISWQTSPAGPKKALTTTKQMNGLGRGGRDGSGSTTWDSQTLKTEGRSWKMEEETTERRLSEEEAVRRRQNAMSPSALHQLQREGGTTPRNKAVKTPPPPPARRRLISADELGVGMQSSCLASRGSRRSDGEEEPGRNHLMRNCASDSEETRSWLDEQRWKLETKRSGKTYQQHSRLEKQLITDLKSHLVSSGKYMDTTQSDTDTDQRLTMSPHRQQQQQQGEEERAGRSTTSVRLNASSSHDDVSAKPPTSISTSSLRRGGQQTSDSEDLSPRDRTLSPRDRTLSPRDRTLTRQTEDLSPRDRTLTRQSEEAVRYAGSYDDVIKATTFDLGISPEGTLVGGPRTAAAAAAAGRREPVRSMSLGDDPNRQKANYKTKASFFVSGIERPAFSTHQTKYTFSVSPLLLDQVESLDRNKPSVPAPPPRSSAPTSPLIPKRGDSSRQAVQRSQRKLVCSPTLDDLEQSLRLILEQTNQSPTDKEVQVLDKRKLTTPSREVVDDEVIILKPIGPGVQTLEPEKDGTLRRRPITPLIPLSVTNSQTNNDANKGPASPNWTSTDYVSSQQQQQQGQFNQQLGQSSQQLGQSSHQGQVNFQYSTETLRNAQPQQTTNMRNDVIMTDDQQLQQQLWLQQQQQQLLQQQQQLLLQQQQRLQQQQQQSWQQQQPSWQQPQQQSWQQQTWQRQQSWPLQQQQQAQQPPVTMTPQSLGTLSRQQGVTPVNQVTATPLSQAVFETTQVVSRQELVQQPVTSYNMDTTTQMSQPLFIGVQKDQVSRDPQQGNTLHTQQHNQQQHVFVQSAQQLNAQQLNAQQLNAQQLNAQQLNAQLMGSQQQMNPKQMGSYQTLPQVSMQQGVQQGVQQPVIVQQPIGVQQPISVQQRETAKYMTYEETLSSLPPQQVVVGQPQISGVQQMGLIGVQNQGQQVQQQMQQQVQQQMQQQHAYSQVLQSSSTLEHGSRNNTLPNGRQGITGGGGGGGGVGGGSWTLDTRTRSPAPLSGGGMSPGGRWPSVGYNDTLQRSQTLQQQQQHQVKRTTAMTNSQGGTLMRTTSPSSVYSGHMGSGSVGSLTDGSEFTSTMPRFVRDTSKYWHKPNISRDEAINLLKDKPAGSFVVRNSTTFQGGYGLALKVAQLPPNVQAKGDDLQANLVRHFLIESSSKGVRLKGCSNEPVFGSLAQLVYQHSITPLALPCKLLLPGTDSDTLDETDRWNSDANLLTQGPACNALYVDSVDTESLTGPEALSKAIGAVFGSGSGPPKTTSVQFKVSYQGITLTDNKHRLFFRRHYPLNTVTFCGMDGKDRRWTLTNEDNVNISGKLFGFVARKSGGNGGNACHLFLDVDKTQSSASTIVGLVTKVMMGQGQFMKT